MCPLQIAGLKLNIFGDTPRPIAPSTEMGVANHMGPNHGDLPATARTHLPRRQFAFGHTTAPHGRPSHPARPIAIQSATVKWPDWLTQ